MKGNRIVIIAGIFAGALSCSAAYGQGKIKVIKPKQTAAPAAQPSSEPDKVLYDRAMTDLKKKRYEEERLSLNVLITTYPDSEYLDKAKLAVADSYYTEGGVSNLTQAIGEYKSFIVFFPFDDKAPYAQMQIGMAHYKMMEKSDRDTAEALAAEGELQTFLLKYPNDKLVPYAQQKLRDVQEVIADGEYKVARFYYLRPDYRASAARLVELTERYPLYSESDEALWMLGDIYSLMKRKGSRNEDDRNHWADLQGKVLDRIVTDYPLSPRAAQAKEQLKAMGMAVPEADPTAVTRMRKQQAYVRAHHTSLIKEPMALMKTGPDVLMAAQSGTPNLTPPADSISAKDILSPTTSGPTFNLAASGPGMGGTDLSSGAAITAASDAAPAASAAAPQPDAPANISGTVGAPTTSSSSADPPATPATSEPAGEVDAPTTSASAPPVPPPTTAPATTSASDASTQPNGSGSAAQSGDALQSSPAKGESSSNKNESSSSRKKRGMKKLNPF